MNLSKSNNSRNANIRRGIIQKERTKSIFELEEFEKARIKIMKELEEQ